jgi:flavodoxin
LKNALVVYHSRSGHTRRVAQALAGRLEADLEEIRTRRPYVGTCGVLRCGLEAALGRAPAIRHAAHDPSRYRLLLIGTPVWAWSLPGPVRAWVQGHPAAGVRLAFFCTQGGSGAERVFAQLQAATGRAPEATLTVTEAQLEGELDPLLDRIVARLATAETEPPPRRARAAAKPR